MLNTSSNKYLKAFNAERIGANPHEPMALYHGTDVKFTEFRNSAGGLFGSGIYMTPYSGNAQEHGQHVLKVCAAISAPLMGTPAQIRAMRNSGEADGEFTARLQLFGYDGIIVLDAWGEPQTVVAFEAHQVDIVGASYWEPAGPPAVLH